MGIFIMKKLQITNLDSFFELDLESGFEILYRLESRIKEHVFFELTILIPYNENSSVVFDYSHTLFKESGCEVLFYEYSTTVS